MTTQPTGPNPMGLLLDHVEEMAGVIRRHEPEGMVEVLAAYQRWPEVLEALGRVWQLLHDKAAEAYPIAPSALALIEAVRLAQQRTAEAAGDIAPTLRALHRRELEALENKKNRMWDHRANEGK